MFFHPLRNGLAKKVAPSMPALRKTVVSSHAEMCFEKPSVTSSRSQRIADVSIQLWRVGITKAQLEVSFS